MLSTAHTREEIGAYLEKLSRRLAHTAPTRRIGFEGYATLLDRLQKLPPLKRHQALRATADEATARLVDDAIQESTLVEYARAINALEDELARRNLPAVTQDSFIIFLDHLQKEGASFSTAVKYQAALLHFQTGCRYGLSPGESTWASRTTNPTLKKVFDGLAYKRGNALPRGISSTGVLDVEKWQQLREWVESRSDGAKLADIRLSDGLKIVIHAALRQCEVISARCRDYNPDAQKLTIRQDKRDTAITAVKGGGFQPLREKWIVSSTARLWFEHRVGTARGEDYLFDPSMYKVRNMADLVKRAALALHWPAEVKWTFHSARHGGDQTIDALLPTVSADTSNAQVASAVAVGVAAAKETLAAMAMQQSKPTRARYLNPLTARQEALRLKRLREEPQ